ncbi:MAG: ABC-F family ATP-binding cassette domain-containing protein [Candidatus ainarchaeum sp.]|jgi:ATP-binding cassette, subfamily F, member 3|nr:ABC-F family ATP-binding cassette domain-containing protein [Candidatus ainarchaeum sp.]MDD3086010.1 ABC-F family ATP-binding cassette domain-containing protein [Candidatus ainarchaeum sp.]MDD4128857.1 ABC-F family ATP-binding cassette domain-containing protein [Candidatus ainarchaeum sp.]
MALEVKNLSISIGKTEILSNESVGISDGSKIGLIGRNGVGKTTFLKAILKKIDYSGEINFNGKAAYFSQHIEIEKDKSAGEVLEESTKIHHQNNFEEEIKKLEELLANPKVYEDHERLNKLTEEYLYLQNKLLEQSNTKPSSKIKSIIALLEIKEEWLKQKVHLLSTGQRAIIALAQILSSDADLLLLDEPTNHLDFKRLNILQDYLKKFKGTVVIVTHDRYFLDQVCDSILKIENSKWIKYNGNYTAYIKTRELNYLAQQKAYELEQDYLANEKDKIARIGKSPLKVKQGKYREKLLERREVIEKPDLDKTRFEAKIEATPIHANIILELENLSIGYDKNKPLISNINYKLAVGERVILIGENGIGKSTLFKTIEGRIPPLNGKINLHSQGKIGYVDQELKDLNNDSTLYEEIYTLLQDNYKTRQHLSLGGFLTNEEVNKPIAKLSLGEKARLNLIKMLIEKPNLLLLDEPTNHMDLDAREILEKAFLKYEGTILAVSHDKYFIEKIAQRVIKVENNTIKEIMVKRD